MSGESTVLFDGACGMCSRWARWIGRRDRLGRLRLVPVPSEQGDALCRRHGIDPARLDSVVLIDGGRAWRASDAVLRIAGMLRWPWPLLRILVLVPRALRDACYRWVAVRRRRGGASCRLDG